MHATGQAQWQQVRVRVFLVSSSVLCFAFSAAVQDIRAMALQRYQLHLGFWLVLLGFLSGALLLAAGVCAQRSFLVRRGGMVHFAIWCGIALSLCSMLAAWGVFEREENRQRDGLTPPQVSLP